MAITLSDRERRYIALFEAETDAAARDCVVIDDGDRVLFVVAPDDMARAVGPDGRTVNRLRDRLGKEVDLIADADTPEAFVANALAPAAVYGVTVENCDEGRIARADVDEADMGVAIGTDGRNIEAARLLAKRHFDVNDIELG